MNLTRRAFLRGLVSIALSAPLARLPRVEEEEMLIRGGERITDTIWLEEGRRLSRYAELKRRKELELWADAVDAFEHGLLVAPDLVDEPRIPNYTVEKLFLEARHPSPTC